MTTEVSSHGDASAAGAADDATAPSGSPPAPEPLPEDRFLDRELSWLAFNERVLELAEDRDQPLLERSKFLAIFASNLDEFFMVRVAGLKRRIATGIAVRAASGLMPREVLEGIYTRSSELMQRQAALFHGEILPGLEAQDIHLLRWEDASAAERDQLSHFFRTKVFPVLTPLAVDPAHPFPYISGLSLNLAVVVRNPSSGTELFARVKVPPILERLVSVGPQRFVPLEDVIAAHLGELFPGMDILQHHAFRVTRNEDLEVEEDDAENLLLALERELMRRRFGPPVRLEVEQTIDPHVLDLLVRELGIGSEEVVRIPGLLDLTALWAFDRLPREDLKLPAFLPRTARDLAEVETSAPPDVLEAMRDHEVLLHHPYDSFSTSVQRFLEQAATDPKVLAIKQTLYRTSGDSPIVDALVAAAEEGKQVLAIVEIKARFDEQANIDWARKLEEAGCHVVYGLVGLKTHCKLSMVVRDDGDRLRRYIHLGTGNYHPKTARLYEDVGLLTTDEEVGDDVARLFNVLSGYSMETEYNRLLVAPHSIRSGLVERIEREVANHRAGLPARVRIKCNSIVDEATIDALYRASQSGVAVDVWVRGICALRPGVPGLSDNLRVRSVLGRFLEHSRLFEFANGGDPEIWIGSADLMHRNLDRRIEVLARLGSAAQTKHLGWLFDLAFDPGTSTWHLGPDGRWTRVHQAADGSPLLDVQSTLIARQSRRSSTSS
jgi:polyphosphate kinase